MFLVCNVVPAPIEAEALAESLRLSIARSGGFGLRLHPVD